MVKVTFEVMWDYPVEEGGIIGAWTTLDQASLVPADYILVDTDDPLDQLLFGVISVYYNPYTLEAKVLLDCVAYLSGGPFNDGTQQPPEENLREFQRDLELLAKKGWTLIYATKGDGPANKDLRYMKPQGRKIH